MILTKSNWKLPWKAWRSNLVRNDGPILALNIGSSSLKSGNSASSRAPDLAQQVKGRRGQLCDCSSRDQVAKYPMNVRHHIMRAKRDLLDEGIVRNLRIPRRALGGGAGQVRRFLWIIASTFMPKAAGSQCFLQYIRSDKLVLIEVRTCRATILDWTARRDLRLVPGWQRQSVRRAANEPMLFGTASHHCSGF
jgi:hypothetical protein